MKQYRVHMTCTVHKIVTCSDCTKKQAEAEPFSHAIDEYETDQLDWKVNRVDEEEA